MIVELTWPEMTSAAMIGVRRQISAMVKHREDYSDTDNGDPFSRHILGAMAELAVAKCFNLFWADNIGRIDGSDVGGMIEVRCRRIGGNGLDLSIKERGNKPDKPYLLVHAEPPKFELKGWLYGRDRTIGKMNSVSGVYWIQPTCPPLHPVDELHGILMDYHKGILH